MPVSERIQRERQARYDRRMAEAKTKVPEGDYCYGNTGRMVETTLSNGAKATVPEAKICPYWRRLPNKPEQSNGYCGLLKAGDWMKQPIRTVLLWDQVKDCNVNHYDDDEGLKFDVATCVRCGNTDNDGSDICPDCGDRMVSDLGNDA